MLRRGLLSYISWHIYWIDAIIMDRHWMRELDECLQDDFHKIRKQEVIAISGEDF